MMMKTILSAMVKGKLRILTAVVALTVVSSGAALAATYTGSKVAFVLNKTNLVSTVATKLYSNAAGAALTLGTHSTSSSATPLSLDTKNLSQAPMKVDSDTKVANLNADSVDGKDGTAMGVTTKTNEEQTGACTTVNTFSPCAPVTVKVPTGRQYKVTLFSSLSAASSSSGGVGYCPSINGFCLTKSGSRDSISLAANYAESAASSVEYGPLSAGTYTFATALQPSVALNSNTQHKVQTTVLVTDALAGPSID